MIDHHQLTIYLNMYLLNRVISFYVPAGTVHAIGSGILILETQQSSDTTYRIYDYDRKDKMVIRVNYI